MFYIIMRLTKCYTLFNCCVSEQITLATLIYSINTIIITATLVQAYDGQTYYYIIQSYHTEHVM